MTGDALMAGPSRWVVVPLETNILEQEEVMMESQDADKEGANKAAAAATYFDNSFNKFSLLLTRPLAFFFP